MRDFGWPAGWSSLKLFGTLEYYQQLYVVAGVWCLNIVFSWIWLSLFNYGPLEWVWRSLTYWKLQPLSPPSSKQSSLQPAE